MGNLDMELPNKFRIGWWAAIFAVVTWYLYVRYPELVVGKESVADVVVFLAWICIGLLPLVSEVTLFGITLKRKIDEVEKKLSAQITSLESEIHNTVAASSIANPSVTVNMPQSDSQLRGLEKVFSEVLRNEMSSLGITKTSTAESSFELPKDVEYLVSVRINIEKEIRRIFTETMPDQNRYTSVAAMTKLLANREIITRNLSNAILEVYRTCSGAAHGEAVTEAQKSFVMDLAPEMIITLRAM